MTLKSLSEYSCPQCKLEWLPYQPGLACPSCKRAVPDGEVTGILAEALESARYNKRLYGRIKLEYWIPHRLGDHYLEWGFAALQKAEEQPQSPAQTIAVATLMDIDLGDMALLREHIAQYLEKLIERYRDAIARNPADWVKMPEPEKPFFGRKIIEDT